VASEPTSHRLSEDASEPQYETNGRTPPPRRRECGAVNGGHHDLVPPSQPPIGRLDAIPRPGVSGRWTRAFAITSFTLAGAYLGNSAIQGTLKLGDVMGWQWMPVGIVMIGLVALASRLALPSWFLGFAAAALAAVWGLVVQTEPVSDFAAFYEGASSFASSPSMETLHASKSPAAILVYGSWMAVMGTSFTAARLVGALAHGIAVVSLVSILDNLGYRPRVTRFSGLLFALSPGIITYSSIVGYEPIFFLTAMPGLALFIRALTEGTPPLWLYATAGALLGLSYLATPVGGFFALGAALLFIVTIIDSPTHRKTMALITLVASMALSPIIQTAMNVVFEDRWSPTTSSNAAMGILNGTSLECNGRWCPQDLELAGFLGEDAVNFEEASDRALEIAGERWRAQPLRLLSFSATTKVQQLWREESHWLKWALHNSPVSEDWEATGTLDRVKRLVDSYHFGIVALLPAALIVVWRRRQLPPQASGIAVGLIGTAGIYLVMVVQQRYHLVFLPFVFSLIAIASFGERRNRAGGNAAFQRRHFWSFPGSQRRSTHGRDPVSDGADIAGPHR
jgi:hypothetical protein